MISVKCDKCGKEIEEKFHRPGCEFIKPGNQLYGKDLCDKCFKQWKKIDIGLTAQKIFNKFVSGDVDLLDNVLPAEVDYAGGGGHDGHYHVCPFCGTFYGDYSIKVGEAFDCNGCGRKIILSK